MDESRHLPPEILEMILSRLPAKSLLRFMGVCKSWKTLISSTPFIHTHLLRNSHSRLIAPTQTSCSGNFSRMQFQDDKFILDGLPELPSPGPNGTILCSCNGLLLLEGDSHRTLLLWNPSLRKIRMVFIPYLISPNSISYGFHYDPVAVDLKIVVISYNEYVVYSCKNDSWSDLQEILLYGRARMRFEGVVHAGGALYWVAYLAKYLRYVQGFLCYDGYELKTLQKPKDLNPGDDMHLFCLRDRLCVWLCDEGEALVRIWMKEEKGDGWIEFMKIENVPHPWYWTERPMHMDENEIIVDLWWKRVMRYSLVTQSYREYEYDFASRPRMFCCVDSLIWFPHEKSFKWKRP